MPMSIIRASAWRSSAGCWRPRASGSASSRSPTGNRPSRSRRWASRGCFSASPAATWIRWSTATPRTAGCATTMPTRRAARAVRVRIAAPSSTPSAAARRSRMCRSCSAASRRHCAVSRITITGPTRCAVRSWPTPRRICCCMAMPSGLSWKSRTGLPPARRRVIWSPSVASCYSAGCPRTTRNSTPTISTPPTRGHPASPGPP